MVVANKLGDGEARNWHIADDVVHLREWGTKTITRCPNVAAEALLVLPATAGSGSRQHRAASQSSTRGSLG